MKAGYIPIYYPANAAEETAVPTGAFALLAGETAAKQKNSSGVFTGGGDSVKNNFAGTVAPTVSNDSSQGYAIGSRWIDTVADESYICTDATAGAALWSRTSVGTIAEVAGLQTSLDAKVDKVTGKQLSTEDFTATLKTKLDSVMPGAEINMNADWGATSGDAQILNKPTSMAPTAHTHAQADVTSLTADLAAKQATLVSGTNIRTINNSSVVGSGNVAISPDLPGSTATTILDEGIGSGNATVDRASVAGQTVLKYLTTGTTTFKGPLGVTSVQVLLAGAGAGGDPGVSTVVYGAGGGGGEVFERTAFTVVPGTSYTVTVGAGGAPATVSGTSSNAGSQSVFSTLTAPGGGATVNSSPYTAGGSAKNIDGTPTSYAGGIASGISGGGGAGSGANGNNGGGSGGAGGAGVSSSITGTPTNYGGGGGGGGTSNGAGGAGGGGNADVAGTANTGGGGGAGGSAGTPSAGGSGIVIIRFTTQSRSYQALTAYADDTAAKTAGLLTGQFYRNSSSNAVQQVQ